MFDFHLCANWTGVMANIHCRASPDIAVCWGVFICRWISFATRVPGNNTNDLCWIEKPGQGLSRTNLTMFPKIESDRSERSSSHWFTEIFQTKNKPCNLGMFLPSSLDPTWKSVSIYDSLQVSEWKRTTAYLTTTMLQSLIALLFNYHVHLRYTNIPPL